MAIQKQVPVDEAITYVEFSLTDTEYPFVAASTVGGGEVMLEEITPRGEAGYGEFFTIMDTDPDEVVALAEEHDSAEPELLTRHENGGLFEFVVSDNCPAVFLGEQGGLPRKVESIDGKGYIAAEVPASVDATALIDRFLSAHPDAELETKRHQPYSTPMFSHRELHYAIENHLTDRQQEVLTAAHEAGYYAWPRETSGDELAEELGISPPTLHQHLRAAEQKLISLTFESQ